jgi:ribonuclease HII
MAPRQSGLRGSTLVELPTNLTGVRVKTLRPRVDHRPGCSWVIGLDEVGMGCLAGPVVAAAFAFPLHEEWLVGKVPHAIRDSKSLSRKQRLEARAWLLGRVGGFAAVIESSVEEIDTLNILRASHLAMMRCFENIRGRLSELPGDLCGPVRVLVDGNRLPAGFQSLAHPWCPETIVKGDAKSFAIAAASILAKTHRDELMEELARQHPGYGWESNVGYPTTQHRAALRAQGPTLHHRRSFELLGMPSDAQESFAL